MNKKYYKKIYKGKMKDMVYFKIIIVIKIEEKIASLKKQGQNKINSLTKVNNRYYYCN